VPRLKVFRTTSGIHDHVVAAPSRPAALKAWGARTDLFSMGVASEVTDAKVKKKALEHPGEVIRISRSGDLEKEPESRRKTAKRRVARPSRKKLDSAEKRLEQLVAKQGSELAEIDRELKSLERKRERLQQRHDKARSTVEEKLERTRNDYEAAVDEWPGD
jgi:predicted RNase H-like nuclease (RuvC/YqgF family)